MDELTIPSEYLQRFVQKLRAVMVREALVMPNIGGNASDDEGPATLQENPGDLLLEELKEEIDAMDIDHKHELVAVMWIGRGDFEPEEWNDAMELAADRHTGPTSTYLLSHPRVADQIANGLEALGYTHLMQDGRI